MVATVTAKAATSFWWVVLGWSTWRERTEGRLGWEAREVDNGGSEYWAVWSLWSELSGEP